MFSADSYNHKMIKTIDVFNKELGSLRTGRANANMLDLIKVDVYGQKMPINQLGTITTPEPRMINIQVWDLNNVNLIDSSIKKSELGLNPQIDGQLIRLPIPDLSEERRNEMKKIVKTMGEKCQEILMLASEGMSMQEMQEVTGVKSLGTVLSRLSNCRKDLKEMIS